MAGSEPYHKMNLLSKIYFEYFFSRMFDSLNFAIMVRVEVKKAISDLSKAFENLSRQQQAQAAARAINHTILKGRTDLRGAVKKEYNIPQRYVAERISVKRAAPSLLIAEILAGTKPVPMDAFSPRMQSSQGNLSITRKGISKFREAVRKRKITGGVSIEVHKGKREIIPFAFLSRNTKPRVFARGEYRSGGAFGFLRRKERINSEGNDLPIKPLISVSVYGAAINANVQHAAAALIQTAFSKRYVHELKRLVEKMTI